ncbi:DNA translocase FtsK [Clostridium pasteurianum DSM 525 = ATCC 6013]|uniref:Cell division FtsK/SpoIIIE n=1 Tax=Clostridium pasteurianum DSM 525 = ATCC 6013 TaxID=1262449 RepID=A0A0H3J860_CLOPA|nr:DNA translocase FtsK [Clostridium pasteurianum]AJA48098.1 DNA translocase FtsK [Clostridium pasteurianum DSM 525 = ATCC 6013]AJA52086.1 DNA translocase FtsK [Clostridium pasteurianum DSM 525 = ATCC 6013]AOZ75366.1 cell division protein FtsK [Clostridium pasteurianum DSM 525 = ATCC 6013]AOZ79161.1 cell division protein FtsK [Clostridium pasteurianum]ELP60749.1 Sporulation protein SpoIIIE, DNA segregation ATPase [Clostridium pasteurianum DSM 525 = ATCC 6013]
MARRKNVKNNNTSNKNSTLNSDIAGVVLICFGIFIIFSLFFTNTSGILGTGMRKLLFTIIGLGAYIFPFILILIGMGYMIKRGKLGYNKKFYGFILFIINTLLIITMINLNDYYINGQVLEGIKRIYSTDNTMHGGIISYIIDIPISRLFGKGCYVVFFCIYIVSFVLISKRSLGDSLKKTLLELRDRRKIKNEISSDYNIQEKEDNSILKNTLDKIKATDFIKSKSDQKDKDIVSESNIEIKDSNDHIKEAAVEDISEELEKEIEDNSIQSIQGDYELPSIDFLNENELSKLKRSDKKELLTSATKLTDTLNSFGVDAKVIQVTKGPSVTRYELQPSAGVKVSKIVNLSDDIALNLASAGVRIEAPIPGKAAIGIEVPNKDLTPVVLREVIESESFVNTKAKLAFCLGKDIGGNCVVADLSKMPHVLIAGATGSGKSVCINTLIISILYKYFPDDVKLLMIDPKVVELSIYNGIPHLLIPVVTNPKKAAGALSWAVNEMTRRYKIFADNSVRNIEGYNELFHRGKIDNKLPWIVIIIDELADLMMVCPNDVEDYIGRLAQMARAAGMHLVIATQRPSVDVITGVIKANIPSRISFAVSSQIDSRTILDTAGAEKLLGKGDMLFYPVGESKPLRIQGAFISEEEVEKIVTCIKNQNPKSEYREEIIEEINNNSTQSKSTDEDELLNEAIKIVIEANQASTSLIQRKLRIGYNRAARIVEQLEEKGIISKRDGSKPRNILVTKEELGNL